MALTAGVHLHGTEPAPAAPGAHRRALRLLVLWSLLALAALAVGLAVGSVALAPFEILAVLTGAKGAGFLATTVVGLRLPRVLAAFATGGLLALAGSVTQVLLGNPLGDPYVLGISGGAAVGALLVLWLAGGSLPLETGAAAGSLLALLLVLWSGRRSWRTDPAGGAPRLLLAGVVLAAGWSALVSLILALVPDAQLRGMVFWLIGDLGGAIHWQVAMLTLAVVLLVLRPLAADLNVMMRGDAIAFALGVDVAHRRLQLCLVAALATAVAVTTAGAIGFVGLLVPHAVRLVCGNDHRLLLPASALAGGSLLTLADTAARTVAAPAQLPVGVLTALLGVPLFLWLLAGGRRS